MAVGDNDYTENHESSFGHRNLNLKIDTLTSNFHITSQPLSLNQVNSSIPRAPNAHFGPSVSPAPTEVAADNIGSGLFRRDAMESRGGTFEESRETPDLR